MADEKIKIKCTNCSTVFRERGARIKNGFQLNCPQCNRLITFDTNSEDMNIRKAFQSAKALRLAQESAAQPIVQSNITGRF
jgi:Zn finger protein HypA/HybF involved in hydrogenase expression